MNKKRLIVIGGGAAGFFCAVNAAKLNANLEIIIVEKTSKLLSKVRISGGGRCNVTHACFNENDMLKKYPRGEKFLKKAFQYFFTTDTINWFNERGVALKTEADGRMFPASNTSQTIIDCLMKETNKYGVEIRMNTDIIAIEKTGEQFKLSIADGREEFADYICIASGGYPKSTQFDWLKKIGHTIEEPVPSLFTFNLSAAQKNLPNTITQLMGVVVDDVVVKISGTKLQQQGPLLITHWGFSGPCVLKLSAYAARELSTKNYDFTITINWLPTYNENTLREKMQTVRFLQAAQKVVNKNPFGLPNRFWEYLVKQSDIKDDCRWADLPAKEQNKLIKNCCVQEFAIKGKTTFKEEFVTAGGINLAEIDANTMQSKLMPNLFFAGEVINVDGVTGGFNFQNAWTTGFVAAKAIAEMG